MARPWTMAVLFMDMSELCSQGMVGDTKWQHVSYATYSCHHGYRDFFQAHPVKVYYKLL